MATNPQVRACVMSAGTCLRAKERLGRRRVGGLWAIYHAQGSGTARSDFYDTRQGDVCHVGVIFKLAWVVSGPRDQGPGASLERSWVPWSSVGPMGPMGSSSSLSAILEQPQIAHCESNPHGVAWPPPAACRSASQQQPSSNTGATPDCTP